MLKRSVAQRNSAARKVLTAPFHAESRQFFERLFNAPKGFGKFYPPGSSSAGSGAAGNAGKTTAGAAKTAKPGGGAGGGGGGGGKKPSEPNPDASFNAAFLSTCVAIGMTYVALSAKQGTEISMQEFQSQLLEAGDVDRIIIANKTIARVVLKEGVPVNTISMFRSGASSSSGGDTLAATPDGMYTRNSFIPVLLFLILI